MLQRLNSSLDEEVDGVWPRARLEEMNNSFVAAVEAAFQAGNESLAAARATVQVKSSSRRLAEEAAIGAAWRWFVDAKFEATAVEVLARVRVGYPNITAEQVREGFRWRVMEMRR
jgi:hypothetical protein